VPFNYNNIPLNTNLLAKLQHITTLYDSLETALTMQPDCRQLLNAITHLEQSHMWLVKALEREQLEQNFRNGQSMPQPSPSSPTTPPSPKLSPEAAVLEESRIQLDNLMGSIKELTETVAVKGFPIHRD
jgi:hypothetical protein